MKFALQYISLNQHGGRIGLLSGLPSNSQLSIETPFALIATKGGSVPHLTQDIFHKYFSRDLSLCIPAQHFIEHLDILQRYKSNVASFSSLKGHPVSVTIQDPAEATPNGFNDSCSVSVFTYKGRVKLCPTQYSNLIEAMQPDWYEALCDADTPEGCSDKRVLKSHRNSLKFLHSCVTFRNNSKILQNAGIMAPLLGGHNKDLRKNWVKEITDLEVDGFSLLGLHTNGPSAETLDVNMVNELSKISLEGLPESKPRQAPGAFSILSVISLVENGIDVFDSSLPYLVAERGRALCFDVYLDQRENDCSFVYEKNDNKPLSDDEKPVMYGEVYEVTEDVKKYEINLKDKRYFDSQASLVNGCDCYTCRTFTRAYIHHLLSVREMLANVLLMLHNLSHWQKFFATIREAIKSDRLWEYKSLLKKYS